MTTLKYNLKQINELSNAGFCYEIPEDTYDIINYLCSQVGSVGIPSRTISKTVIVSENNSNGNGNFASISNKGKKKRGNKGMEISNEEWESVRNFQVTKIEQKVGIDADINELRLYLNKLTDKTFLDIREKIIDKINLIIKTEDFNYEGEQKLGMIIYDICSTNKFYSKIFADLFAELASIYVWLSSIFKEKYANIMEQYNNIQYIDSDKDYDGFCEMNKKNEKRRAITTFYLNLGLNGFISKEEIVSILKNILESIVNMINVSNKKNEVDELTEIVSIMFNKEMIDDVIRNSSDSSKYNILDKQILEIVVSLAQKKAKDYPSLSNKSIFKYMDMVDM